MGKEEEGDFVEGAETSSLGCVGWGGGFWGRD